MLLLIAGIACSTTAFAKPAKCKIDVDGAWHFNQVCSFEPTNNGANNGSFVLRSNISNQPLLPDMDIHSVAIYITQKNIGEIRAKTVYGDTRSWGTVIRSQKDKACWRTKSGDTSICAYGM